MRREHTVGQTDVGKIAPHGKAQRIQRNRLAKQGKTLTR